MTTAPHSQTLDRGLRVLEVLADADQPLTSAQLVTTLELHRSIVYRILRTLEDHRLVTRRPDGRWEPGVGLAVLARGVAPSLHGAATRELAQVADDLGMTAFLAVADRGECLTVLTVEPRHTRAHVSYRPGGRHALDRGAPGIALLAGGPARRAERLAVTAARREGFAKTRGEVLAGMSSVASPIVTARQGVVASVAVVYVEGPVPRAGIENRVRQAAAAIAAELS
jgi:DNA-binding IclR family transcriptional regulator